MEGSSYIWTKNEGRGNLALIFDYETIFLSSREEALAETLLCSYAASRAFLFFSAWSSGGMQEIHL